MPFHQDVKEHFTTYFLMFLSAPTSATAQTCHHTSLDHPYISCKIFTLYLPTVLLFCPHSPITCWIVNGFARVLNYIHVSPLVPILVIQPLAVRYSSVTPQSFFLSFFISFYLQPPGIFTNGLLDLEPPAKVNPLPPAEGGPALTHALPHLVHTRNTVSTR